jgi:type IV secretory pathway VirB4 component
MLHFFESADLAEGARRVFFGSHQSGIAVFAADKEEMNEQKAVVGG